MESFPLLTSSQASNGKLSFTRLARSDTGPPPRWVFVRCLACGRKPRARIRPGRSPGHQFLMDPDEIPLADVQKLQDLGAVGFGFLGPRDLLELGGVRSNYFAHRQTGDSQHPRDLVLAHSLSAQFQNRGALRLVQHCCLLPLDSSVHTVELVLNALDLASRIFQMAAIHPCRGAR